MGLRLEVALASPLWQAYSYQVPAELAPLVQPLSRVRAPLRGKPMLGFALNRPEAGDTQGLKPLADVLDDPACPALPPELLGFFTRLAAHYQAPLGQALAWALPAGLGGKSCALPPARQDQVMLLSARGELAGDWPRPGSAADRLWRFLRQDGPRPLPELRERFPQVLALARRLEAKGLLAISHQPLVRDLLGRPLLPEPRPLALTPDQQAALTALDQAITARGFKPFLLHGVTGSGKTEVYVGACQAALAAGRGALVLTPEIGLCLRLEGLLRQRLGAENVAALHSGLSPAARRREWRAIASGQARVVVGARSAVFAPLADPGVICVDEEQDEAYKQEDRLRYHARDLALLRGQEQACPVLLGTATPAVTTWQRAKSGEITLLSMPSRIGRVSLPKMEVVDLRQAGRLLEGFLSPRLHAALRQTLEQKRQAILFLNRRGFAPALLCPACGHKIGCPACSLSLTLHAASNRLVCHVCGHQRPVPPACPACGAEGLKPLGLGTEGVVERLAELLPEARLARLDRDTASTPQELRAILKQVAQHEVDILVGTQMITKGHHFPLISLVGVLLADQALALPDFRASERAYTMLTQVAGRAGREGGPGLVIVQTYDPQHPSLRAALANDHEMFYANELAERQALGYPPFRRLVGLKVEGVDESAALRAAQGLARHLEQARARLEPAAQVLGPAPAPLARAAGRWRFLLLIKAPQAAAAARILRLALHQMGPWPKGVHLGVDVDPVSLA